jgi:hypothetical protein
MLCHCRVALADDLRPLEDAPHGLHLAVGIPVDLLELEE